MNKGKTFNTDTAAEMFISGARPATDGQQTGASPAPAQTVDLHESEREREAGQYIQELTAKAAELEKQAAGIRREAEKAKLQAIAAANAKYKATPPAKYREKPDYKNPRTRRVQVLLRPDVFNRAKEFCEANQISFNRFVEVATLALLDGGEA